jgi:hypothetical protein
MARRPTLEEELHSLSGDPRADETRARIAAALRSGRSPVTARAARLVKEHALEGFEAELKQAFERFLHDPVKSDPTCQAKQAALEALDYGESLDPQPFLRAVEHVQIEGLGNDTAAALRARGVLALARVGHADFELVVARLLVDPLPPVRQAALDALAHRGDRSGAPLALFKLRLGDDDPLVTLAAMTTLMALAPEPGLVELRVALDDDRPERRELAAVALGQARGDDALAVLLDALEGCTRPEERDPILRGIGLHRSERALTTLLAVITERAAADARVAVEALGARRFEPGLAERVRAAAAQNERAELAAVVDEVFAHG